MKTAGIIVEYNPFHNGHQLHMERTRQQTGADYIIAVMSGNFVQRGAPALTDKYCRTKMALLGGADLVLELPVLFATGSAGDFAAGAVSLLDKLGVVDALCFGSECGSILPFEQAASLLIKEPPLFSYTLQRSLKRGLSFPHARALALKACLTAGRTAREDSAASDAVSDRFLASPNNILGLEYCCALQKRKSKIRPVTIFREGADYHDAALSQLFPSATALRQALSAKAGADWASLSPYLPPAQEDIWTELLSRGRLLFPRDLTKELRYRLLTEAPQDFSQYADVTPSLSDKLSKSCLDFADWDSLCDMLKSRELTYSRISRALCHILLSIRREELLSARSSDYVPYARILGFRSRSLPLLSAIKKNSSIPLLSKLADASRLLSPEALSMLRQDIAAAHLYESAMGAKTGTIPCNEYTRQICIL